MKVSLGLLARSRGGRLRGEGDLHKPRAARGFHRGDHRLVRGRRIKLRYAHQGGMNPPVIVIHGNSLEHVTDAYKRFLEGRFRKEFNLIGTPLRIELKTTHNPYADRDES